MSRRILNYFTVNSLSSMIIIFIQVISAFLLALFIYRMCSLAEYIINVDGRSEIHIFKSALSIRISTWTIIVCLIVGLPFRLNNQLYKWWTKHYYIPIIGLLLGISLLIFSWSYFKGPVHFTPYRQDIIKVLPNFLMLSVGWFLTLFMTLHIHPSGKVRRKLEFILSILSRDKKKNEL